MHFHERVRLLAEEVMWLATSLVRWASPTRFNSARGILHRLSDSDGKKHGTFTFSNSLPAVTMVHIRGLR